MAISWGTIESGLRVGIEITQSPSSVGSGTSEVTLTIKYYAGNDSVGFDWDDTQTMTLTGSATGSYSFHNDLTSVYDSMLVVTKTVDVTTSYTASINKTFSASISGAFNGATPSKSLSHTVDKRPYAAPNAPTGLNITDIFTTGAQANWTQPSNWGGNDTDDYKLQIAQNSGFTVGLINYTVTNATIKYLPDLLPNTVYYVRVRGYNAAGDGTYSSTVSFTTNTGAPNAAPATPTVPTVGFTTATINWVALADAAWVGDNDGTYTLEVDDDALFGSPMAFNVAGLTRNITGLTPNITYYARVRAYNSVGAGPNSPSKAFTTQIAIPGTAGPAIPGVTTPTTIPLVWTAPASWGGDNSGDYKLQYSTSSDFTTGVTTVNVNDATSYVVPVTPGVTYYFRVKATNSYGDSAAWSTVTSTTALSGGKIWNGSAFVPIIVKVWNGTAFVVGTTKVYNGTMFVSGV